MPKQRKTIPTKRARKKGASAPFYQSLLKEVSIYTDGSASHTSRHGGWAYIIVFPDGYEVSRYGSAKDVTNNAMELQAAIEAINFFNTPRYIKLYSDSAYLVNTLELQWWKDWQRRGFINKNGKPTPNRDRWVALIELSKYHIIKPIKVKAHSGHSYNEKCDKMAKRARKAAQLGYNPEDVKSQNRVSKRKSRKFTLAQKEGIL